MTKASPKLSDCYVPLPQSLTKADASLTRHRRANLLERRTSTADHPRDAVSLRRLRLEAGVTTTGSSRVELGRTKVLAQVLGPLTASSDHVPPSLELSTETGVLHTTVQYVPNGVAYPTSALTLSLSSAGAQGSASSSSSQQQPLSSARIHSWLLSREADLAKRVSSALAAVVPLTPYPKCALILRLTVLKDDGSVLPALLLAASLALQDAAVELFDIVTCCSTAVLLRPPLTQDATTGTDARTNKNTKQNYDLLADPDRVELETADAVVTLAVCGSWKEVTLWEQSGAALPPDVTNAALEMCRQGCRTLHKFVREYWMQRENENDKAKEDIDEPRDMEE